MRKDTQDGRYRAPIELERDSYTRKLREDISGTFSASSHALSPLFESSIDPLAHCLTELLWKEPVVTFFSLWISFAWGVMFLVSLRSHPQRLAALTYSTAFQFFTVIPLTFSGNHGWSTGVSGLGYSGVRSPESFDRPHLELTRLRRTSSACHRYLPWICNQLHPGPPLR